MKHVLLFVAANPFDTDRLRLDEECAAIERELRMSPGHDDLDFYAKWAVSVDELMRHLNELQPTILHFSGHGSAGTTSPSLDHRGWHRDVQLSRGGGIFLQHEGSPQYVNERALAKMIASASPTTRVVVLNACYGDVVAEALRREVDCVVGMTGLLHDTAARSFAVAFYRALGNRRSVGNALAQAIATLDAKQQTDAHPVCASRESIHPDHVYLSNADTERSAAQTGSEDRSLYAANAPDGLPANHDRYAGESPTVETVVRTMMNEELLTRLSKLLPAQFEQVLYLAGIPYDQLPAATAAQAMRAVEVMRYAEQQNQVTHLAQVVQRVVTGGRTGSNPR